MAVTTLKQRVIIRLVRQFGRPRGIGGRLAGWVMAHRDSNRRRNLWVVTLLEVRPTDRVLEIGFGPGIAIAELARHAAHVYGIDHSEVMLRQAGKRNAAAIRAGRVTLRQTSVDRLPSFAEPLDAILAVNTLGFWPNPGKQLSDLRGLLRPGGRIALVSQPRIPGSTTARASDELRDRLNQAGFVHPRVETLALTPPVACVLATRACPVDLGQRDS
jgi:ubiquinone/menaquinone biosynthesis C-methylase UbiE